MFQSKRKGIKSIEFGVKINNIQKALIEHFSFKVFNKVIRIKNYILMQKKFMNARVKRIATNSIYTNKRFNMKYEISTSFVRKGRAVNDNSLRKMLRTELSKEKTTQPEEALIPQSTLLARKNKNTKQES